MFIFRLKSLLNSSNSLRLRKSHGLHPLQQKAVNCDTVFCKSFHLPQSFCICLKSYIEIIVAFYTEIK